MDLKYARKLTTGGRMLGKSVSGALEKMPLDVREQFVEAVYEIISATGAETFQDLIGGWAKNTGIIAAKLIRTDAETYKLLLRIAATFWLSAAESVGITPGRDAEEWLKSLNAPEKNK